MVEEPEEKTLLEAGKPETSMMDKVEELVAAVNRLRPRGSREGRGRGAQTRFNILTVMCYNCRKRGHFQRNCPEQQMGPRYSRGRGGPFMRGTFVTRRGQMRAPFGRDRATFHVEEEDQDHREFGWQDEQWIEDAESGNF